MSATGVIILAAGSSLRLGRPKQLLAYQNKSLIQHITAEALKAKLYPVVVVTGAGAEAVSAFLKEENVTMVYNEQWQQGMASGIVAGMAEILSLNKELQHILIAVCDQPFVSAKLFGKLIAKKAETGKEIIACAYADTVGTPVLFGRTYFETLRNLKGAEGAKGVVKMYRNDVSTVPFPQGSIDIDTEEDYKKLMALNLNE